MKINKEEIIGKALKEYCQRLRSDNLESIKVDDFYRVAWCVLDAMDLVTIRDASNNIKGYETKRLYIDADKMADEVGQHIYKKIQRALAEE